MPAPPYGSIPGSGPRPPGPEIGVFLKYWTMGIIMSCIAYGVAFTLSVLTLFLLHKSSRNKKEKTHYILISYVVIMVSLATVSISSGINANLAAIQNAKIPLNVNVGRDENAIIVVLVIWGSDGFLLWRAAVLYEGIGALKRKLVLALIGFLMFAQTACGILYISFTFIPALSSIRFSQPIFIAFASTTLTVNWIITGMVVFRIGQYRDRVSSSLGTNYGRPFRKIMAMCVESAILIIIFSSIFLIQNLRGRSPFSLSRLLLVQIYIIAPLLILYRVAQGKAFPTYMPSNLSFSVSRRTGSTRERSTTLRFQDSQEFTTQTVLTSTSAKTVEVMITHDVHKAYPEYDPEMERGKPNLKE